MAKQTTDSFPEEREEIILDILKKQGKVRVTEVCDILSIAPSTARLLLQGMQDKGLLQRTHGGAIPIDRPETPKVSRDFSQIEHYEDKLRLLCSQHPRSKTGIISPLEVVPQLTFWQHFSTERRSYRCN